MKRRSGGNFETSRSHFIYFMVLITFSANYIVYGVPLEGVKSEESIGYRSQLQPAVVNTGSIGTLSQANNKPATKITVEDISTLLPKKKDENQILSNKQRKTRNSTIEESTEYLSQSHDSALKKPVTSNLVPTKPLLADEQEKYKGSTGSNNDSSVIAAPATNKGSQLPRNLTENHLSKLKTEAENKVPQPENVSPSGIQNGTVGQKISESAKDGYVSKKVSENGKAELSSTENMHRESDKAMSPDSLEGKFKDRIKTTVESIQALAAKDMAYFTTGAASIESLANLSQKLIKTTSSDEAPKSSDISSLSDKKELKADNGNLVPDIKHETDEDAELTVGIDSKEWRPIINKQANVDSENKFQISIAAKSHETEVHAETTGSTLAGFHGIALEYLLMVLCMILIVILLTWRRFWYTVCIMCCPRSYQTPNNAYKVGYRPLNRD